MRNWSKEKKANPYFTEKIAEGCLVLSALIGTNFEAVSLTRVVERTELSMDKCRRALLTFESMGWVKQIPADKTWQLTGKMARFSDQIFDEADSLENSEKGPAKSQNR